MDISTSNNSNITTMLDNITSTANNNVSSNIATSMEDVTTMLSTNITSSAIFKSNVSTLANDIVSMLGNDTMNITSVSNNISSTLTNVTSTLQNDTMNTLEVTVKLPFSFFLQSFLSTVIIIGNGLIVATLTKSPHFRTTFYKITRHLAIADSITGLGVLLRQLLLLTVGLSPTKPQYVCLPPAILMTVSGMMSLSCSAILSLERFLSLRPRQSYYRTNVKKLFTRLTTAGWIIWIIFGFCQLYAMTGPDDDRAMTPQATACLIGGNYVMLDYWKVTSLTGLCIVFAIIILHGKSYVRARRQVSIYSNMEDNRHQLFMMTYLHDMSPAFHIPIEVIQPYAQAEGESYELRLARGGKHLTQTSMIVVLMTCISWVPFMINIALNAWLPPGKGIPDDISASLGLMVILNAVVNIFIYTHKMQPFRKAMVSLVACRKKPLTAAVSVNSIILNNQALNSITPNNQPLS